MITPYYIPNAVKKWKDKKAIHNCYKLFRVLPNGDRVYIDTFGTIKGARREKATLERLHKQNRYCIIGGGIICK